MQHKELLWVRQCDNSAPCWRTGALLKGRKCRSSHLILSQGTKGSSRENREKIHTATSLAVFRAQQGQHLFLVTHFEVQPFLWSEFDKS